MVSLYVISLEVAEPINLSMMLSEDLTVLVVDNQIIYTPLVSVIHFKYL